MATSNYKWPGVYPSIQDLSGVVATTAVTTCAYVGEAEFGPIYQPTLLSSASDYINRFGAISSKYGYAGYSLAIAAETITSHYFVRVVDELTARFASTYVPKSGTVKTVEDKGWTVDEIEPALSAGNASGLFNSTDGEDEESAFIVVASNPNNRILSVSLSDTTINENKKYRVLSGSEASTTVTLTVPLEFAQSVEVGDKVEVSNVMDSTGNTVSTKANGIFELKTVDVNTTGDSTVTYTITEEEPDAKFENARILKMPEDNETTFGITVMVQVGKTIQTVETYQYCTLYQAKDNYGSSMFVEDVVNDSQYIRVYVNPNVVTEDAIIIPDTTFTGKLTGGTSGDKPSSSDLNRGWDCFSDRTQVSVSLLLNSGYVSKDDFSYQSKMLEIAENRRDCFCLFDIPVTEVGYESAIDWRKNTQGFNTYRGAIWAPWVKGYDSIQGRGNFIMCPSAFVAKLIGAAGDPWNAPAGPNRGILSSSNVSPTGVSQTYNATEGGILYTDNQINCIIRDVSAGYVNWGQRTLQQKPSALDRINVARTIIYIETILRDAARWHLFENNTAYERMQLNLQFSTFLDTIVSAGGIEKYQVVVDDSDIAKQNNQLIVRIYIWPTYATEVIILETNVMSPDSTVTVSVQGA